MFNPNQSGCHHRRRPVLPIAALRANGTAGKMVVIGDELTNVTRTALLAGLAARGTTVVESIFHIDRGYPNFAEDLRALGANVTSPDSIEARAAAKMLQHEIKVYIGSSVAIELKAEGGVERSQGKAKRVVDLRGK
mgnify:CR=1 FL=1